MEKKGEFFDADDKRVITVGGEKVKTYIKDINSANSLEIEVGTTGYCGGDTGHGGRTYFRITDLAGTDMSCEVHGTSCGNAGSVELSFGGDSELTTFVEALEFAAKVLRSQIAEVPVSQLTQKGKKQQAFKCYLEELVSLYETTGKLRGMSELQKKYHVAAITQIQFFECGLHKAARQGRPVFLSPVFCNKVYEYILDSTHTVTPPQFEECFTAKQDM